VLTPDGSRIVYRSTGKIVARALDQLEPTILVDAGNPYAPFVSPDGQWVGFFDGTVLKKVAITGGPAVNVSKVDGIGRGATWGEDGTIVFATLGMATGLQRVSAVGGTPTVLTKPDPRSGEGDHALPEFLPGGRAVLLTLMGGVSGDAEDGQVAVLDLRTGTQKVLVPGGRQARYAPSGHLVYAAAGTLRAVAFDPERLEVHGTVVPVVPRLVTKPFGSANFDVAADGTLVYVPGGDISVRRTLVWVDRAGREDPIEAPERAYLYPRVSPDGTRVALAIRDQQNDIWIWDLARRTLTRLTFNPNPDNYPVWTPDSRRLIFGSARGSNVGLFWQAADGAGTAEPLSDGQGGGQQAFSVSPDGTRIVLRQGRPPYDLHQLLLGNPRRTTPLFQTPFSELNAEISPDGRWLAYQSNESGRDEIYVRPFPNASAGRWQVSSDGGSRPVWARNGQELFYLATGGEEPPS